VSSQVSWVLELDVHEGRAGEARALVAEMVRATEQHEPGTLDYRCHLSDDGGRCHFVERYADSAAVLAHVGNFGEQFAGRLLAIATPVRLTVYGSPSAAVKEALAGFSPAYMEAIGGFTR